MFFILSGIVIQQSTKGKTAAAFLVARFKRLYPEFLLALLLIIIWQGIFWNWSFPSAFWTKLLANCTMISGFLGYQALDGTYWTLEIEWFFYLLVAIFIQWLKKEYILPFISLLSAVMLALKYLSIIDFNNSIFQFMALCGWFGIGMSISEYFFQGTVQKSNWIISIFLLLTQFLLFPIVGRAHYFMNFPESLMGISVIIFCFYLAFKAKSILSWTPILFLGRISYPWYLTHQFLFQTLVIPSLLINTSIHPLVITLGICLPASMVFAYSIDIFKRQILKGKS